MRSRATRPKALRDRAADGAVFLVRTGDMGLIRKDLARAIDRTLTDESLPPMVRSKTAYMIATAITVPALAGSAPDEDDLEVVRATVESLTRILLSAPEEMWRICAVMQDDVRTHTHAVNTAVLSMVMSKELGIESEEALREVGLGAFLHDLGLLRLPRRLLRRDMTGADEALYRLHPRKGVDMLRDRSGHAPVFARYILEHHERWDGTGYPQGLHGDQISVPGRLIAITAAFDVGTQVGPERRGALAVRGAPRDEARSRRVRPGAPPPLHRGPRRPKSPPRAPGRTALDGLGRVDARRRRRRRRLRRLESPRDGDDPTGAVPACIVRTPRTRSLLWSRCPGARSRA